MIKRHLIKDKSFYMALLSIAVPIVLQNIISISVNIMDTVMLGKMGEIQLSASSLANNFIEISHILHLGIAAGGCVLVAQYWGAGDKVSIKKVISLMFRISIMCGLILMLLAIFIPDKIMNLYTPDAEVVEKGVLYLEWMLPVFILHGLSIVMTFSFRSMRKVMVAFIATIVTFFVNIFFNWVFIFGNLGAPRMEIAGAALGTTLSRIAEFITIAIYFFRDKDMKMRIRDFTGKCSDKIKVYIRFGLPVIISDLFLTFGNNSVSIIMGHVGTIFVAAFAIVAPGLRLVSVASMGLAQAAATMTGNIVGGESKERAFDCGFTCFILSIVVGIMSGVVLLIIGGPLLSFYDVLPETRAIATEFMYALSFITVFQAIGTVLTKGVLRGGGDSRYVMIFDTAFLWITSIPLGYLCGLVWHSSAFITFVALRIDNVFKAIVCSLRLNKGKWIKRVSVR